MNTFLKSIILFFLFFNFSLFSNAQSFEGIIEYEIKPTGFMDASTISNAPKKMTLTIKGNKCISQMTVGKSNQIQIVDGETKTTADLLEIRGSKYVITKIEKEIDEELAKLQPTVIPMDSTKEVLGYQCKSVVVNTLNSFGFTVPEKVYYCEGLGDKNIYFNTEFKDVNGIMLIYELESFGNRFRFEAKKIKKTKISDKKFIIPKDYTEITLQDLQTELGGTNLY